MTRQELDNMVKESLRDWFKKEKWVRISTSGNIAGPCGTSKNKKNPDRCLPKAKAQSLTKAQRAATARKKKKAGAKGKTVVKNTKKAKVTREAYKGEHQGSNYKWPMSQATKDRKEADKFSGNENIDKVIGGIPYKVEGGKAIISTFLPDDVKERIIRRCEDAGYHCAPNQAGGVTITLKKGTFESKKVTKEDIRNLVVGTLHELQNEGTITEKDDRCTRIAKRKYDTWPSAYASGAVVRCRRGEIWKGVKEEVIQESDCKHGRYFCNHDKNYKCRKGPKKSR